MVNTSNFTLSEVQFKASDALLNFVAAPGTVAPTYTLQIGGSDGTNLRAIQTDANGNLKAVGSVASGSADSGNPVKAGGVFNTTLPTFTNGQRGDLQINSKGALYIAAPISGQGDGMTSGSVAMTDAAGNPATLAVSSRLFNGTTNDAPRSVQGAASVSTGKGVAAVEEAGRTFSNIKTATTTTSKSGAGFLHTLTINTYVASATVTIYDNTAGSGATIATITLPSTITSLGPHTLTYDIAFATGLTIVTSGATDLTVAYR